MKCDDKKKKSEYDNADIFMKSRDAPSLVSSVTLAINAETSFTASPAPPPLVLVPPVDFFSFQLRRTFCTAVRTRRTSPSLPLLRYSSRSRKRVNREASFYGTLCTYHRRFLPFHVRTRAQRIPGLWRT